MKSKHYEIYPTEDPNVYYFEHNVWGDLKAGKLWFEKGTLIDYDGVWELPLEVVDLMEKDGWDMSYAMDGEEE